MDVGGPSEQPDEGDRVKAAFSDALKRAAVKFGIGRYLYRLPHAVGRLRPWQEAVRAPARPAGLGAPGGAPGHPRADRPHRGADEPAGGQPVEFVNFDRWMGGDAKRRAVAARQKWHRRNGRAEVSAPCPPAERTEGGRGATEKRPTQHNTTQESKGMYSLTNPSSPEAERPPSGASGEALLVFECVGKKTDPKAWHLSPALVEEWSRALPALDVLAECRKVHAWVAANPARRKTHRGMPRFLYGWLCRTNDRSPPLKAAAPPPRETTAQRLARIRAQGGAA
jgi:hypothetical protein